MSDATTPELDDIKDARDVNITKLDYARAILKDKVTLVAVLFLAALVIFTAGANFLAPHPPTGLNFLDSLLPPLSRGANGEFYLLGTDELGRDMFSRLIYGARVSVSVGVIGALVSGIVGVFTGLTAGYKGGLYEDIVMRLVDGMLSLPSLLVALFVLFVLGGGFVNLILVFSILHWMVFARLSRGLALEARSSTYVKAAKALGATDMRIIFYHILPNVIPPILVLLTLEIATLILSEASLSFLGFGVQPPDPSWGLMIADGREHIRSAWWLVAFPGIAIFLTALSLNLVANWLRAVTDPVQRWRWFAKG
ncbi:peptide/nickel transport system permease protein [Loktanella ponticola]|uniref:Peptide/nickel transport system permease protein n=1 Tax=Yoonia ponticola TaxID=1524255 RepID=A0A7W9BNA8_9RHOB|nr:ABC transporter permease [Yoonia ponticola]MBB5723673.1 peptide/nickel transport system permease protein [Yoonia ponticola]